MKVALNDSSVIRSSISLAVRGVSSRRSEQAHGPVIHRWPIESKP